MSGSGSRIAFVVLFICLSGCATVNTNYQVPETPVPDQWQGGQESGARDATILAAWWTQFNDPLLNSLITDALTANKDLASARARLRQARAQRDLADSDLGPSVNVSGSASRTKGSREIGGGVTRNLYNAGFDASWDRDIFGGTQQGVDAAEADLQASLESLRDARITLIAEVARNYVELRTAEQRLSLAESSVAAQQETYDLVRWRQQAGLASELEEAQARTQLETTRAGLPGLHTAIAVSRHSLAILLGQSPTGLSSRLASTGRIPVASRQISTGIPADTLRQRPDVRVAERSLAAQAARLGQAKAARYPSFRLSGSLGLESLTLGNLFTSDAATNSLLASITAPIFDSGAIRSNIEIQDALLEQSRLNYQTVVLTALQDVEDALVELKNTDQRQTGLSRAVDAARSTLEIARYRYQAGLADFQSVLDSQQTLLNLEDQLASGSGDYSSAQIRLYKALGGGWSNDAESVDSKETS